MLGMNSKLVLTYLSARFPKGIPLLHSSSSAEQFLDIELTVCAHAIVNS